jgi:hypothetical protein
MARKSGVPKDTSPRNNFFAGMKREMTIDKWVPKHNGESEKRVLINFELPLTGQQITGHPVFITDSFASMEKEGSVERNIGLAMQLEGMSIEFYDTPNTKDECQVIHSATLDSFEMARKADGDSHITVLRFGATVARTVALLKWLHTYERKKVFAMFEATQGYIPAKETDQMQLGEDKTPPPKAA